MTEETTKRRKPIYKKWWFWLIVVIALPIIIASCSSNPGANTSTVKNPTNQEAAKPSFVFDVAGLVGKNIDEVRTVLGKPVDKQMEPTQQQLSAGMNEWANEWKKEDYLVLATYNPTTREITDFFLSPIASTKITNPDVLLPVGNLTKTSKAYRIEPVREMKNPSNYTGIKIIPR